LTTTTTGAGGDAKNFNTITNICLETVLEASKKNTNSPSEEVKHPFSIHFENLSHPFSFLRIRGANNEAPQLWGDFKQ
jgi:hypothetical protein